MNPLAKVTGVPAVASGLHGLRKSSSAPIKLMAFSLRLEISVPADAAAGTDEDESLERLQ